jgi:hypothetical protein
MIVYSSDEDIDFKTPPNAVRVTKRKRRVAQSEGQVLRKKKEIKIERIKSGKSLRFPKLYKFSILRAANKRKSL